MPSFRFTKGISQSPNVSPNHPYDLRNARVNEHGEVEALQDGEKTQYSNGGGFISDEHKPWFPFAGSIYTQTDGVEAADEHNGLLYTTGPNGQKVFDENGNDVTSIARPEAHKNSQSNGWADNYVKITANDGNDEGISGGHRVKYLVIPVNDRGEAGAWMWFSWDDEGARPDYIHLEVEVSVNSDTSYCLVYRTREYEASSNLDGNRYFFLDRVRNDGGLILFEDEESYRDPDDMDDRIQSNDAVTLRRSINFHALTLDDSFEVSWGDIKSGQMYNDAGVMMYADPTWPTPIPQLAYNGNPHFLDNTSDGGGTMSWVIQYEYSINDGTKYGPFSIHMDNYVNLEVAWQGEQAAIIYAPSDTGSDTSISTGVYEITISESVDVGSIALLGTDRINGEVVRLDTKTDNGDGTFTYDITRGLGETIEQDHSSGVNVYIYRQVTRVSPNKVGKYPEVRYTTGGTFTMGSDIFLFGGSSTVPSSNDPVRTTSGKGYVTSVNEPNVGLLSEFNRPLEVTIDYFDVPSNEKIVHLGAARQSEEEAVKSYVFYIATKSAIYVADRGRGKNQRDVQKDIVNTNVGVATRTVGDNTWPLVAETSRGLMVVGTDQSLYLIDGRKVSEDISSPIWFVKDAEGDIQDIAYDPGSGELWAQLPGSGGIYIYSFSEGGWMAQYEKDWLSDSTGMIYVEDDDTVYVREPDGDTNYNVVDMNGKGSKFFTEPPQVVTQPLVQLPVNSVVGQISLDLDFLRKEGQYDANTSTGTDDDKKLEITSGDTPLDESLQYPIEIENSLSENQMTFITGRSGSIFTVYHTLDDPTHSGSNAFWALPCTVTVETRTGSHQTWSVDFEPFPQRLYYPNIRGSEHQLTIEQFSKLRSVDVRPRRQEQTEQ